MEVGEGQRLNEVHAGGVVCISFARKPYHDVGADAESGICSPIARTRSAYWAAQ